MFPFRQRNRFDHIFRRISGTGAPPTPPPADSPYPIYNEFLSDIAPLIRGKLADENRMRIQQERMRMYGGENTRGGFGGGGDEQIIDLTKLSQAKPQNVHYAGMDEYQRALIGLREKELAQKGSLAEQGLDLRGKEVDIKQQRADVYEFRAKNPNVKIVDNKAGKMQAIDPQSGQIIREWDSGSLSEKDKIELQQQGKMAVVEKQGEIGSRQIAERGEEQRKNTELQGRLQKELAEIKDNNSRDAIERRAEIQRDLLTLREQMRGDRPNVPSQEKTNIQLKYNKLINLRPDLREYVELDDEGMPVISDDLDEAQRLTIHEYIYGKQKAAKKEEIKDEDKPPEGMKAGGKWVQTKRGRVYMEP